MLISLVCFAVLYPILACTQLNQSGSQGDLGLNATDVGGAVGETEQKDADATGSSLDTDMIGMNIPVTIAKVQKGAIDALALSLREDFLGLDEDADVAYDDDDEELDEGDVEEAGEDQEEVGEGDGCGQIALVGATGAVAANTNLRLSWPSGDEELFFASAEDGSFAQLLEPEWLEHFLVLEVMNADLPTKLRVYISQMGGSFFVGFLDEKEGEIQSSGLTVYNDYVYYYKQIGSGYEFIFRSLHDVTQNTFLVTNNVMQKVSFYPDRTYFDVAYPAMIFGISSDGAIVKQTPQSEEIMNKLKADVSASGLVESYVDYAVSSNGLFIMSFMRAEQGTMLLQSLAAFSEVKDFPIKTVLDPLVAGRSLIWLDTHNVLSYTYFKQRSEYSISELELIDRMTKKIKSKEKMAKEAVFGSRQGGAEQVETGDDSSAWHDVMIAKLDMCMKISTDVCSVVELFDMNEFTNPERPDVFGIHNWTESGEVRMQAKILQVVPYRITSVAASDYVGAMTEPYFTGNSFVNGVQQIFFGSLYNGENTKTNIQCPISVLTGGEADKRPPTVSKDGLLLAYETTDSSNERNIQIVYMPTREYFWLVSPEQEGLEFLGPKFSAESQHGLSFFVMAQDEPAMIGTVNLRTHPKLKQILDALPQNNAEGQVIPLFNNCTENLVNVEEVTEFKN